jgi:hypothetical protein
MHQSIRSLFCAFIVVVYAGCSAPKQQHTMTPLEAKSARFTPTVITADTTRLSPGDRRALHALIAVTPMIDQLYLRQSWSGSEALRERLKADTSPEGRERLTYFLINMGPWSRLDHDEPFIEGVPPQPPPGANYYPEGMTKEEFATWLSTLKPDQHRDATGFFTTIRRNDSGALTIVPYNKEYSDVLLRLAPALREAAAMTDNPSLKDYLLKRADAFMSNDYYESDIAWMRLDSPIDITIGPYEVYMDELFNYKAAFEAFITLRNDEETAKLARFATYLQEIEDHLPIAPKYRNPKLGALAPISVVDEVAIGGESRAGVQTAAFNLPNDERVTREVGSKRVMLRNVQEAKFQKVLIPISRIAIDPTQQHLVKFDHFFTHILAHELMHGLGPHSIVVRGRPTNVRKEMKELGSALEEAKADVAGLFALQYLIDKGTLPASMEQELYATFLAGIFRTLRFGSGDAHGKGMALQCNYFWDRGGIAYNESTGVFSVNVPAMKEAVAKLTGQIMTLQAEGNYGGARELLEHFGTIRPAMQRTLDKLSTIPVDIRPLFPLAGDPIPAPAQ